MHSLSVLQKWSDRSNFQFSEFKYFSLKVLRSVQYLKPQMSKYKANVWTSLNLYDQNLKRGSCRVVVEQNFCKKKHPSVIRNTYIACIKGIYVTCKENRIYIPLYLTKFSRASRVIQERRCKVLTLLSQSLQRIIATIMLAVDIHYIVHNHHLPGIRFWTHVQRRRVCEAPKRAQRRSRSDPKHQRLWVANYTIIQEHRPYRTETWQPPT